MNEKGQIIVNRNDTEFAFDPLDYSKKATDKVGQKFYGAVVTKDNFDTFVKWAGIDTVLSMINGKNRLMGQQLTESATQEQPDGSDKFIEELFVNYATEFSTRGESIADLEERRDNIIELMNTEEVMADAQKFMGYARELKSINTSIDAARRPRSKKKNGNGAVAEPVATKEAVAA